MAPSSEQESPSGLFQAMTFHLRDYQQDALEAIRFGHQEYDSVLLEIPTGTGKTIVFTKYASNWREGRTLVVAPQITLIGQASRKIQKETGIMPAIEQAENWSNENPWARSDYVVASKQTLCSGNGSKRYERFKDVGLVILDEAHYACTESYKAMVDFFRDGGAKVLGVTATAKRHDKKSMGQIFDDCCYQMGILDAINDGWLVPVKVTCKQLEELDLSDVQTSNTILGKDFNQKQLAEKLENPKVIYEIAEAVNQETKGEKTAIFCQSVDEAQAVAELLVDKYQIKADWICADKQRCSDARRHDVMSRFCDEADESLTHLANVGILTTGWDYPGLKCIVMARPTKSLPLYTQIFGRVTRAIERDGKPVVDFEGSDPSSRKAAIAASSKPFGRVIDLVDVSLKHKICTSVDVLGGNWSLVKQQEVAELIREKEGRFSLDEMEEELRKQRAAREANARFHDVEVNPFGGNRSNGRNGSQQIMATDKQRKCLWVLGIKDVDRLAITKAQAGRMIGQLKEGMLIPEVRRVNRLHKSSDAKNY